MSNLVWVLTQGVYEQTQPIAVALTWEAAQAAAQEYHETSEVVPGSGRRLRHDWQPSEVMKTPEKWAAVHCAAGETYTIDDCELGMQAIPLAGAEP